MQTERESETLKAIEETQARLRESIEDARRLADESQALVDRHRREIEDEERS